MLMNIIVSFFVMTFMSWIILVIVIPIARKLADFSMPHWPEALWKLAVVAAAGTAVSIPVGMYSGFFGSLASAIVTFALLYKWFDVDLFGAIIVSGVSNAVEFYIGFVILSGFMYMR